MSRLNLIIEVSEGLEIIDKCYGHEINHGQEYDRFLLQEGTITETLNGILRKISVRATVWSKQRLAEHCNNVLLSHSTHILNPNRSWEGYDLYYPHLRIFVYPSDDPVDDGK